MSLTLSLWLRGAWPSGVRSQELHTIGDTGHVCLLDGNTLILPSQRGTSLCLSATDYHLVAQVVGRARVDRRQDLVRLQTALCHLGILDEPVIFVPKGKQAVHPPTLWQNDPTIDPVWLAWVCADLANKHLIRWRKPCVKPVAI
jgi:hypothetical protein